jgi:hypothetical protein
VIDLQARPHTTHPRERAGSATTSHSPGYAIFRITQAGAILNPPFQQVLVQSRLPETGHEYNLLYAMLKNATKQTFTASDGFRVSFTGQHQSFPILTGDQKWVPRQFIVFYLLTKKYYPPNPVTSAGFQVDLGGSKGTVIPGPSGIYQHVVYNPATFPRFLNFAVVRGPGAKGHTLGLPDTAIWEFIPSSVYVVPL